MTETQRKWLLKYIDKEWLHTDFTYAQDKQDLLEAVIRKNEWYSVVWDMNGELMESQSGEFAGFKNYAKSFLFALSDSNESFTIKLIQLSPLETADLICRWKGVE
jgi:predicted Zn-dependent protease